MYDYRFKSRRRQSDNSDIHNVQTKNVCKHVLMSEMRFQLHVVGSTAVTHESVLLLVLFYFRKYVVADAGFTLERMLLLVLVVLMNICCC